MIANIYDVIEDGKRFPKLNTIYSAFMLVCIVFSLVPLLFHEETEPLYSIDKVTVSVFIFDYILRFITARCKYDQGVLSFVRYPFSFLAIVDILSILPSLNIINKAFKAARIFRLAKLTKIFRTLKTVRVLKFARYSKSAGIIKKVIIDSKETLILLTALSIGYVFTVALIVYNVEPQTFNSFFEALYWSVRASIRTSTQRPALSMCSTVDLYCSLLCIYSNKKEDCQKPSSFYLFFLLLNAFTDLLVSFSFRTISLYASSAAL